MASKREGIILAVKAALEGSGKPTGLTVHRFPTRPLDADDLPAIALFPLEDKVEEVTHDEVAHRILDLGIELRAQATSSQSPDEALDPIYVWAVQAVHGDATLRGLTLATWELSMTWEAEERNAAFGAAVLLVRFEYETTETDPET